MSSCPICLSVKEVTGGNTYFWHFYYLGVSNFKSGFLCSECQYRLKVISQIKTKNRALFAKFTSLLTETDVHIIHRSVVCPIFKILLSRDKLNKGRVIVALVCCYLLGKRSTEIVYPPNEITKIYHTFSILTEGYGREDGLFQFQKPSWVSVLSESVVFQMLCTYIGLDFITNPFISYF